MKVGLAAGAGGDGCAIDADECEKVAEEAAAAFLEAGEAETHVYVGVRDQTNVYVGITKDIITRQAQHGARFILDPLTGSPLTRGQARAVEQAIIEENPQFENIRNSISPLHSYYNQAVSWGRQWLEENT